MMKQGQAACGEALRPPQHLWNRNKERHKQAKACLKPKWPQDDTSANAISMAQAAPLGAEMKRPFNRSAGRIVPRDTGQIHGRVTIRKQGKKNTT